MSIFEITGKDIAELKDDELRELIGLLCESEFQSSGYGVAGVRYGGHQDAKDGGIDVIVESEFIPHANNFIPRKLTAFQVKKSNMYPSDVAAEMQPNGILRQKIKKLIEASGAYIIVSSGSNVADEAYDDRITAMKKAIFNEKNCKNLHLDFIDQTRIATWVRSHPAMILWVRKKVDREYPGWQPYGNWSYAPGGIQEEYLFDDQARLFDFTKSQYGEMSILEGIAAFRQKLSKPGKSIRLTGLSGVGKTRFVQALFDDRIDGSQLNPFSAYYTDISDNPEPDPKLLAGQLVELNQHCILIIDNCLPELHRKLTDTCRGTQISLLTIEYDLRDDDFPEETEVYRLEAASLRIIIQLLSKRYPYISQNDAFAIADFSGGNARIAIALADTIKSGESLASLNDEYLFERLFWQRKNHNQTLLHAAEVLSLLYSFEGTQTGVSSELSLLSSLIDISPLKLYRHVSDLQARGLLQQRSNWRAILPQAIANRLAKKALQSIPLDLITSTILNSGNDRVAKSFFHRLSYLHDSQEAVVIISDYIYQNGWTGEKLFSLSDLEIQILQYIAPVCPGQILTILESAADHESKGKWFTSMDNPKFTQYLRILRYLAYDSDTFLKSAGLLARFASSESEGEKINPIRDYFKALFFRSWSGTLALPEARFRYTDELLNHDDTNVQNIGVLALGGLLQVRNFFPPPDNSFGARPRDFGYTPKGKEILSWYETSIELCTSHILSGKPTSNYAKQMLAKTIGDLWVKVKAYDAIEKSAIAIRSQQSWNEAWVSTIDILQFDTSKMKKDSIERLIILRDVLKPTDLESFVRAYVLSSNHLLWDLEPDISDDEHDSRASLKRLEERTFQIGIQLAHNKKVMDRLLLELVSINNEQVYSLGMGLAKGTALKRILLTKMKIAYFSAPEEKRGVQLIKGFLHQCSIDSMKIYDEILDEIVEDPILGSIYPVLESSAPIGRNGLKRLYKSLELNKCDIDIYRFVGISIFHESIKDDDLAELIEIFLEKENGYLPSSELLWKHFSVKKDSSLNSEKLLKVARTTLEKFDYATLGNNDYGDHILTSIAKTCLKDDCPATKIKSICFKIQQAFSSNYISFYRIESYIGFIVQTHPEIFFDTFLESPIESNAIYDSIFNSMFQGEKNPLNKVSDKRLIAWCKNDPDKRCIWLSKIIHPFTKFKNSSALSWREIVFYLFEKVDILETILDNLSDSVSYTGVTDSYVGLMEERQKLFAEINDHSNDKIRRWSQIQILRISRNIKDHIDLEKSSIRASDGAFE